ncbi:MAG TPA: hypothetical protein VF950_19685 [Planctomycetota bacterium]
MGDDSIRCRLCGEAFRLITPTHLRSRHRWTSENPGLAYKERFGLATVWSGASRRAMSVSLVAAHDRRGRLWTRERLLSGLRRLRSARFRDVLRSAPKLYWTAQRLFGSWTSACRAAKLPEALWDCWPEWTRERVLREIRGKKDVRWRAVTPSLYWAGQRLFGSWKRALGAAGVAPPPPKWTRETALDALRRRARAGRSLASSAVRADDLPLYKAVFRLFKRWRAALRQALPG